MTDQPRDDRRRDVVLALAIALVGAAVFAPAVSGPWLVDDHPLIAENPYVHSFQHLARWFTTDFWNVSEQMVRFGHRMLYYRPLVTASYAIDWQLGGGTPLVFHIVNLVVHGAVAALAFVVLRRWIGAAWPAAVAAVLFAIHPTKAESVAWISGRTDVFCALFLLLATEGIARRLRGARGGLALEVAATVLAYLCKEQAVILPVFVAVEAWVAADRPAIDRGVVVRVVRRALPQGAIAIVYLVAHAIAFPLGSVRFGLVDHILVVLETLGRDAALVFAPHALSIQHGLVRLSDTSPVHVTSYIVIGAISTAALIAAAVAARRRAPVVTVGIAFYLVTLLPTSNVKLTGLYTLVSERFLYVPVLGLVLVAGAGLAAASATWARRGFVLAAAAALSLAMLSLGRARDFADEDGFWTRELQLHPESGAALQYVLRRRIEGHAQQIVDQLAARRGEAAGDVVFALDAMDALAPLVPDHDLATLHQFDAFCADLLARAKPTAVLSVYGVTIVLDMTSADLVAQPALKARVLAARADLAGRLGDDAAGQRFAREALAACPTCAASTTAAALAAARAGSYDQAAAALATGHAPEGVAAGIERARQAAARAAASQGQARLQARASELGALGVWGRAYDVMAPYVGNMPAFPHFAMGVAELAFRAGETVDAVFVLSSLMPADQLEPTLVGWASKMGWLAP